LNVKIHRDDTIVFHPTSYHRYLEMLEYDQPFSYELEEISTTPPKNDWLHSSHANEREYDPSGKWYNYDNNVLELNEINSLDQL